MNFKTNNNKNDISLRRIVIIDFKIIDYSYNEYWHETFRSEYDCKTDIPVRDLQEYALSQYMWELKKETIDELHTKRRNNR